MDQFSAQCRELGVLGGFVEKNDEVIYVHHPGAATASGFSECAETPDAIEGAGSRAPEPSKEWSPVTPVALPWRAGEPEPGNLFVPKGASAVAEPDNLRPQGVGSEPELKRASKPERLDKENSKARRRRFPRELRRERAQGRGISVQLGRAGKVNDAELGPVLFQLVSLEHQAGRGELCFFREKCLRTRGIAAVAPVEIAPESAPALTPHITYTSEAGGQRIAGICMPTRILRLV